jgi:molecular chaperone HtpG
MKTRLKDDVKDVRLSGRLKDSPCCLVGDEGDLDPRMVKMLKAMGREVPAQKSVLEINPDHPIFEAMKEIFEKNGTAPLLEEYALLLLDQALLLSGSRPKDPALFSKHLSHLMVQGAKHFSPSEKPDNA